MNNIFIKKYNLKSIDYDVRNKILKVNTTINFTNKFLSLCINYMLIPLTISYLNQELYGVWITLLSILSWFSFSDIGIGNGLRNKLTECLSKDDNENARKYISTAYITMTIIVLILYVFSLIIIPFLNWNKVFNINSIRRIELIELVFVTITFFLVNFDLSIINQIFYAFQKSMYVGFIQVISNGLTLIGIILLKYTAQKSIIYLAVIYGSSILLTNFIFSLIFFNKNKELSPSISEFSKDKVLDIMALGAKFFIIQIAAIIIFTTDNILIAQIVGPKYVTGYNIVQKLFGFVTMLHTILITPLWSAYTEAYIKKDYKWIKNILFKLNILMVPIIIIIITIFFLFNIIINIWIRQKIYVDNNLIFLVGLYTIISVWNNIYAYFLNGTGYLKLSFWISIFIAIINIPLSIYFGKYLKLGVEGIVIANILCLSIGVVLQPIQSYIILNNKLKNSIFYK